MYNQYKVWFLRNFSQPSPLFSHVWFLYWWAKEFQNWKETYKYKVYWRMGYLGKMVSTTTIKAVIPLVNETEWEKYITLPPQVPAPTSTSGRIEWWKNRLSDFSTLAPVAIAYLSSPHSSAQCERTFSLLGHTQAVVSDGPNDTSAWFIQTDDRLHMSDPSLQALAFVYINKGLFEINWPSKVRRHSECATNRVSKPIKAAKSR